MSEIVKRPAGMPPEDVIESEILRLGLEKEDALALSDYWKSNGYRTGRNKVVDWKAVVRIWRRQGWFPSQKGNGQVDHNALKKRLAAIKKLYDHRSGLL